MSQLDELATMAALSRRPWWERHRPTPTGLRHAAIGTAVVLAIAFPIGLLVGDMASTPLSPEEFARIGIALRGGFGGPDGTNYLNSIYGGGFVRASAPSQHLHEPTRLIDTWATARVPSWRSADGLFPVEMIFTLPADIVINRVMLRPHPAEPVSTWVRRFTIEVSTVGVDGPYSAILEQDLDPASISSPADAARTTAELPADDRLVVPRYDVPEVTVRWVRFRIKSNGGSADYTSLGELELLYASITPLGSSGAAVPLRR